MIFLGLSASEVLTVFGIAGGLALLLYLLKLRRRQVEVPFVALWEEVLREEQTTRLFQQLKRFLSFLLALAILGALAFTLGDPRWEGADDDGRALAIVIDASGSMQATDVEPTRFDVARDRARDLIRALGPNDRAMIIEAGPEAAPRSPLTGELELLLGAVDDLEVSDVPANVPAALRIADDVLREAENAELIWIGDGAAFDDREAPLREGIRRSMLTVGDSASNVAVGAFSVRRFPLDKTRSEVLMELWNPSTESREVEVELHGDGRLLDTRRLTLAAGERSRRYFRDVTGVDELLEARVRPVDESVDHLPLDDRAFARLPPRRRARILVVSANNLYLEAALLLDEYLDVTTITPDEAEPDERFDVVIYDGYRPSAAPSIPALYVNPVPREGGYLPIEAEGEVEGPWFERLERRHPLLQFTALGDVNIASSLDLTPERGDKIVGGDRRTPLIVAGRREAVPFVVIGFDVRASDLPLRVAWPLLLLNTIDHFVAQSGDFVSGYEAGRTWYVPVPAGVTEATIVSPSGEETQVPVVEGRAVVPGREVGVHTIRAGEMEERFASNLGITLESDIAPGEEVSIAGAEAEEPTEGQPGLREILWPMVLMALLAVLMVEWLSYHRRWTV